jgi:hypothetical protein
MKDTVSKSTITSAYLQDILFTNGKQFDYEAKVTVKLGPNVSA